MNFDTTTVLLLQTKPSSVNTFTTSTKVVLFQTALQHDQCIIVITMCPRTRVTRYVLIKGLEINGRIKHLSQSKLHIINIL